MWWPPRSNADSRGVNTYNEDSLTRPHTYRKNINESSDVVISENINEENDQSSAARSLPPRTLREMQAVYRLASPTVALSIDRPEIDTREESVVSYGKSQPNTTKNVISKLDLEEQLSKSTSTPVIKRTGFENLSNVGAYVECPAEVQTSNSKEIEEEEMVSKQEEKGNNINTKLPEDMMMALWSSVKESQARTMQLERQLMQIVNQTSTKNEQNTSHYSYNNSNINSSNNKEYITAGITQYMSKELDNYNLESQIAENGHSFAKAMHTIGIHNDLFDFSSLVQQWQACLEHLQDVKRETVNVSEDINVNRSNKSNKNEVTSDSLAAETNAPEKSLTEQNTVHPRIVIFDKMLLKVLETEHTAVMELTNAWVNERSALLHQAEEHENNSKMLETRYETRLRELNEDHSAETTQLQNQVEELEKQLLLLSSQSSLPQVSSKAERTTTAATMTVQKEIKQENEYEALKTHSSLIVPRTDVGTSRSEWTNTFARPRSYAPLPTLSATPIQQNVIAVNGETQTTLSLEYIRASLWQIYEAKLPRSIRREREYELFELLLREVERLQHAITAKNSLILQLQEQRNRFLSSVTAPLSVVEMEDLL